MFVCCFSHKIIWYFPDLCEYPRESRVTLAHSSEGTEHHCQGRQGILAAKVGRGRGWQQLLTSQGNRNQVDQDWTLLPVSYLYWTTLPVSYL